jgi:hypothetical protein
MPLGTVPLSDSSTGSGFSPAILPTNSATQPVLLLDMRTVIHPSVLLSCLESFRQRKPTPFGVVFLMVARDGTYIELGATFSR